MSIKSVKSWLLIGLILGLSSCSVSSYINPYGVSAQNVIEIKEQHVNRISVANFEYKETGINSLSCRGTGIIYTPNQEPFTTYIKNAFVDELKLAGVYDQNSAIVINGRLEEIDFDSQIGMAKWKLKLSVSTKSNPGYTVESIHKFSTDWVGDKACQQVAQAFGPAVQQLIGQVIRDPRFKKLTQ